VIILSAALDLVGPDVPKGVVLLADVIPSFLTKLCAPYVIQPVPYSTRILVLVGFSVGGMILIALSPDYADRGPITQKLVGVVSASFSSGLGELSFLSLVHFYGPFSLASWGSGTGGAGLIGAGAYALATTMFSFTVRATLFASAFLPAVMLLGFFYILPQGPLKAAKHHGGPNSRHESPDTEMDHGEHEAEGLLAAEDSSKSIQDSAAESSAWKHFKANLRRSRSLFFPL
jgi:battenin